MPISLLDSRMYFSYSQFQVFDASIRRPGCAWTEAHSQQGFARRENNAAFGTLLDFGYARLRAYSGSYENTAQDQRVIEIPMRIPSGAVIVGGPEEFENARRLTLASGDYRLVAAQRVVNEDQEEIDLFFEKLVVPLAHSRIVIADAGLSPPETLLETVECA